MATTRNVTILLMVLAVASIASAAPVGRGPAVPPPGGDCSPSGAWITTARGEFWLTSPSGSCIAPAPNGGWSIMFGDGTLLSRDTPRLVLRVGERVRVTFVEPPRSVVVLTALRSARVERGRAYGLSPYTTLWRVRPGRGVLTFTTTELVTPPPASGLPARLDPVTYVAVYRTIGG